MMNILLTALGVMVGTLMSYGVMFGLMLNKNFMMMFMKKYLKMCNEVTDVIIEKQFEEETQA